MNVSKISNSFFTEHLWTTASKLLSTWIHLNIHNILCCHFRMCNLIKDWLENENEIVMSTHLSMRCKCEKNCEELKKMADWAEDQFELYFWKESVVFSVLSFSYHSFYFEKKCCGNESSLPSFTFCGNDAVTKTMVSTKFPGLHWKASLRCLGKLTVHAWPRPTQIKGFLSLETLFLQKLKTLINCFQRLIIKESSNLIRRLNILA